ncbi:hypothetical protein C2S52_004367 [Perilla frutescens var. hirtella]|nr:hypothetical protein C2S52_004367 [Perilla frutescens var. hirtella]
MEYIGCLRMPFQDVLDLFTPLSVSKAHQRALLLKTQFSRRSSTPLSSFTGRQEHPHSFVKTRGSTTPTARPPPPSVSPSTTPSRLITGRCFSCGEPKYRQSVCLKLTGSCTLLNDDSDQPEYDDPPIYDSPLSDTPIEEYLSGDIGQSLDKLVSLLALLMIHFSGIIFFHLLAL